MQLTDDVLTIYLQAPGTSFAGWANRSIVVFDDGLGFANPESLLAVAVGLHWAGRLVQSSLECRWKVAEKIRPVFQQGLTSPRGALIMLIFIVI